MNKLRASTLAEILIVILVSGIVLISVSEGLGLFSRFSAAQVSRIAESGAFRESYCLLEDIVAAADSLSTDEGRISVWRGGVRSAVLYRRDSLLLVLGERRTDTLFSGVTSFELIASGSTDTPDSVALSLLRKADNMRITIPATMPRYIRDQQIIKETETGYGYD